MHTERAVENRPLARPNSRWNKNIEINLQEIEEEVLIHLADDRGQV